MVHFEVEISGEFPTPLWLLVIRKGLRILTLYLSISVFSASMWFMCKRNILVVFVYKEVSWSLVLELNFKCIRGYVMSW